MLILVGLVVTFSRQLLGHFGKSYIQAELPLLTLLAAAAISCITTISASLLAFTGHEGKLLLNTTIEFCITLFGGIILVKLYDMEGAALTVLIAVCVKSIIMTWMVRKYIKLKPLIIL